MSLLGQLQGVVDQGYNVVALAGTSAGAIVATLYWAGLKTSDIRQFFQDQSMSPEGITDLLGCPTPTAGDFSIRQVNRLKESWAQCHRGWRELTSGAWWTRAANLCVVPLRAFVHTPEVFGTANAVWAATRALRDRGGLFPGERFEQEIDGLIRSSPRIAPHVNSGRLPRDGFLTFGDLWSLLNDPEKPEYFPALTLTATDLSTRELLLIDSTDERFFGLPIAKAVRASGGFPLFFRPVEVDLPDREEPRAVRRHSLVDGGVVCNFPAYVFAQRTRREQFGRSDVYLPYVMRPWINIGLRLFDPPPEHTPPPWPLSRLLGGLMTFLTAATRTHLESTLAESTLERFLPVAQPFGQTGWPFHLLAFDRLNPSLVEKMYTSGREFASRELDGLCFGLPPDSEVEYCLSDLISKACHVFGRSTNDGLAFRATLFVPQDELLVLRYRANMDSPDDNDRDLRLEFWQGLVGYAFLRRRPVVCNLLALSAAFATGEVDPEQVFGLTPEIQLKIRKDRSWLMSVPVFDPETASPYPYGDDPVVGVGGQHFVELDSQLDGALFGVLSLDAGFEYGDNTLPADIVNLATNPRLLAVRDILVSAAWELGKVFAKSFAAEPVEGM